MFLAEFYALFFYLLSDLSFLDKLLFYLGL